MNKELKHKQFKIIKIKGDFYFQCKCGGRNLTNSSGTCWLCERKYETDRQNGCTVAKYEADKTFEECEFEFTNY
jgi:hypothetical protein